VPGEKSQIWRMLVRRHRERRGTREPYSKNFLSTEKALDAADDAQGWFACAQERRPAEPKEGAVTGPQVVNQSRNADLSNSTHRHHHPPQPIFINDYLAQVCD
jgi:hypothetical protein